MMISDCVRNPNELQECQSLDRQLLFDSRWLHDSKSALWKDFIFHYWCNQHSPRLGVCSVQGPVHRESHLVITVRPNLHWCDDLIALMNAVCQVTRSQGRFRGYDQLAGFRSSCRSWLKRCKSMRNIEMRQQEAAEQQFRWDFSD